MGSALLLGCALPFLVRADNTVEVQAPVDAETRALYLRGRFFLNKRTEYGLAKGGQYFEEAIRRAPDYASAYSGLADAHSMRAYFGMVSSRDGHARAKWAALRALTLDPQSAEAHTSMAYIEHRFEWNWSAAERSFRRAISLNPDYALAHHWYASFLDSMGRWDEAIAQARRAEVLDPVAPVIGANLNGMLNAERPGDLLERQDRILEMDPGIWLAHWSFGRVLESRNQFAQAIEEFERAADLAGRSPYLLSRLGVAYATAGRRADARRVLSEIDGLVSRQYVSAFFRAPILAALGDRDAAFMWLERAYDERSSQLPFLKVSRLPLQSDPRFNDLVTRVGLK